MKPKIVLLPLWRNDRESIAKGRAKAKQDFPEAKKIKYLKPQLIKSKKLGTFYTRPKIEVTL